MSRTQRSAGTSGVSARRGRLGSIVDVRARLSGSAALARRASAALALTWSLGHSALVAAAPEPELNPQSTPAVAPAPSASSPPIVEPAPAVQTAGATAEIPLPSDAPAPRADQASGISRAEPPSASARLRWIPRALLWLPRWTVWTVAQPLRLAAWSYERYSLPARLKGALFNVDGTYGVYPVASFSTEFGFNGGLRFVHKNLFNDSERLKLRANLGGRYQQAYGFSLDSGDRFGDRVLVELEARYERRPAERFFGLGNTELGAAPPAMLIDPLTADSALATRFREDLTRVVATVDTQLVGALAVHLSGALMLRDFSNAERDGIADSYDITRLAGFTEGVDNLYLEAELIYDSRRQPSPWQSNVIDATGWYAAAHLGRGVGVAGDPSAFTRYGGELARFFDLYRGSRVLAVRVFLEAATGGTDLGDRALPFIDLPRLGGAEYLRGHPEGRFRDRVVALATAEYTWDLGNFLAAYTFVDLGRPASSLGALEEGRLRVGFGGGVQVHTQDSFITRAQLAGSRDGDVFFELVLSPAFGRRERAGRY